MINAIKYGSLQDVQAALKKVKANDILENKSDNTSLHIAAFNGEPEKLEILLKSLNQDEKAAAINKPNKFGWTPLTNALYPIQPIEDYKKEALKNGVPEAEIKNYEEWYYKRFENMSKTVRVLLVNGANPFPSNDANRLGENGSEQLGLRDIVRENIKAFGENSFEAKCVKKAEERIIITQHQWHLLGFAKQH